MSQLDGSDIVDVARVAVSWLIALRVDVGTRFPATQTSQGKVLLAALGAEELDASLAEPSRSGLPPYAPRPREQLDGAGAGTRVGAGRRGARAGRPVGRGAGAGRHRSSRAAMNVTVHAAETSVEQLLSDHLPLLLRTAGDVSADWALWQARPHAKVLVRTAVVPAAAR